MPVLSSGIGESGNTPIKNEKVAALFDLWCSQVSAICERIPRRVRYVDLTAGCGQQQDGSPTFIATARQIAAKHGLDIAMLACEACPDNAARLRASVPIEHIYTSRWQDKVDAIESISRGAFAFVYHDPNGCTKEHGDIIALAEQCSLADFALHFDANEIKRVRCAGLEATRLTELAVMREHCLIREPWGRGSQWTVMYLSNCANNGYKRHGFYRLGQDETGEQLLLRMDLTKRELKDVNTKTQGRLAFEY